jgi:hypothetical protein
MARLALRHRTRGSRSYQVVCGTRDIGDAELFEGTNRDGDARWYWQLGIDKGHGRSDDGDERSFATALRRLAAAAGRAKCGR